MASARVAVEIDGRQLELSNLDKVLYPDAGFTKAQVIDYYTRIAPVMLPHLAGRPLTLQRYPNGIEGQEWYQQNAPEKTPSFVHLLEVGPRHENKKRIVCEEATTLAKIASQFGVSRERVRQIEGRLKLRLRAHLRAVLGDAVPAQEDASDAAPRAPAGDDLWN